MLLSSLRSRPMVRTTQNVVRMASSTLKFDKSSSDQAPCQVNHVRKYATESSLPKLPVPELKDTLERLKVACTPFVADQDEYKAFAKLISDFTQEGGTGNKLYNLLKTKSTQSTNWLSHDWWLNKAYLEGRDPIMIWSNPGLVMPKPANGSGKENVIDTVTKTILAALDFRNFLKNGGDPEGSKGKMCMDQYEKLFGTCRIPGEPSDLIHFGDLKATSNSIVIARKGHFYALTLPQNVTDLKSTVSAGIKTILEENLQQGSPVGAFTSINRTKWAGVYTQLDQNAVNSIVDSLFVVSLDHVDDSHQFAQDYLTSMGKQVLHADDANIGNRWFDKTVQLIFVLDQSGNQLIGSGLNYEHTPCEAPIPARLLEHMVAYLEHNAKGSYDGKAISLGGDVLKKLNFGKQELVEGNAKSAFQDWKEFAHSLDLKLLRFSDYGKEDIKGHRQSPDSWIQVAITWAYYRLHHNLGACYETAGTRKYHYGRTECIRSTTSAVKTLALEPNLPNLRAAIDAHNNVAKMAANGLGVDRFLLGLNTAANEVKNGTWKYGIPHGSELNEQDYRVVEELYQNELLNRSKHFSLSTSQVAVKFPESFCCYGPLVLDGYGCCYNPTKLEIAFAVSAFKEETGHGRSVSKFSHELEQTLKDMRLLFITQAKL